MCINLSTTVLSHMLSGRSPYTFSVQKTTWRFGWPCNTWIFNPLVSPLSHRRGNLFNIMNVHQFIHHCLIPRDSWAKPFHSLRPIYHARLSDCLRLRVASFWCLNLPVTKASCGLLFLLNWDLLGLWESHAADFEDSLNRKEDRDCSCGCQTPVFLYGN